MALQLTSTKAASQNAGIKALVYGGSGSGKTTLCATAFNPVIISAEGGLLSINDRDVPVYVVQSEADCWEALALIKSARHAQHYTVCLDSISEIAEKVLGFNLEAHKDGRKAYGEMNIKLAKLIRAYRDIQGKHVLFTAKLQTETDSVSGVTKHYPSMPGNRLIIDLPYFFDEVLVMRVGAGPDRNPMHYLQCIGDYQYTAKDRSRRLAMYEPPDFSALIAKMMA